MANMCSKKNSVSLSFSTCAPRTTARAFSVAEAGRPLFVDAPDGESTKSEDDDENDNGCGIHSSAPVSLGEGRKMHQSTKASTRIATAVQKPKPSPATRSPI